MSPFPVSNHRWGTPITSQSHTKISEYLPKLASFVVDIEIDTDWYAAEA
jgi:hypothetical protein